MYSTRPSGFAGALEIIHFRARRHTAREVPILTKDTDTRAICCRAIDAEAKKVARSPICHLR